MCGCVSSSNRSPSPSTSDWEFNPDLTSYQNACRSDPVVNSFDSSMQKRTNWVIDALAVDPSLSLHSLQVVIETLLDTDRDVLKLILEYETDVWNHDELFSLVKDYLKTSIQTLDFCKSIEGRLKDAQSRLSFLQDAIKHYDEDANHLNALEQFIKFKALGLFSDKFLRSFQSVYEKQVSLLNKLQTQMCEVVKKLESVKTWRRLSNVIFVTTFSIVLICSVVAAPPLVTALAAASTLVPLGSMGKWVETLWKKYEKEYRNRKDMMNLMKIQSSLFVIKDLDNRKAIVDRMGIKMDGMLQSMDFAISEEVQEGVGVGVNEIRNSVNEFASMIKDLSDQSNTCITDIKRATKMILERIKDHRWTSNSP